MQKQYKAEGTLFPRAHLSLIGFNSGGYRKYGGLGFCFNNPSIKFYVEEAKFMKVNVFYNSNKLAYQNQRLESILNQLCNDYKIDARYSFNFFLECPLHSGFGTGTNISLACIESICKINRIEYNSEYLIKKSNRGRTSGIGIQTYFTGGFVMDTGVKNVDNVFLPSNSNNSKEIAKPLITTDFPDWEFIVIIPKNIHVLSREDEVNFFKNSTPLSNEEVYEILYVSLYGVATAILENDFEIFCQGLNKLQTTKWKYMERINYHNNILEIEELLFQAGAKAVAMSSLGPSLIAFSDDISLFSTRLQKMTNDLNIYKTKANNIGRLIYA